MGSTSLKYYSIDGQFIKSIKCPYWFTTSEFVTDNLIAGFTDGGNVISDENEDYNPLLVVTDLLGNISSSAFQSYYRKEYTSTIFEPIRKFEDRVLYNNPNTDSIYLLTSNSIELAYHLNIKGAKPMIINEDITNDLLREHRRNNPFFNGDFIELKDGAIFHIFESGFPGYRFGIYSNAKQRTFCCNDIRYNPFFCFFDAPKARYGDNTVVVDTRSEGIKAYTTEDGRIVTFRPDLNAKRMADSARRLQMPVFPEERFVEAVVETVKANAAYVPPYGSGATLYIRPFMFGIDAIIGVKPATEYQFRIFTTPVGPYFKGGAKPITIRVSDVDRAAPHGTGDIKAGLNYAMSLYNIVDAHKAGFDENLYLDPGTRTYVEETGGANFVFITKDNKFVTPKSDSILPSVTRRSLMVVAKEYLGMEVEERPVALSELSDFAECGLCGTAAVISPVGKIVDHGKEICLPSGMDDMGPVTKKLYDTLTGIQMGRIEAPKGWIKEIL